MAKPTWANWNGTESPLDEVRVSVLDRGFLFGDGVYEALRLYGGKPWLCQEHVDRLRNSLRELRITCDVDRLEDRLHATIRNSGISEGLVYIQVTRGAAKRTHYFPPATTTANELIYVQDYGGDPYASQREKGVAAITFPDLRWARRDIKSVNLLGNCLAAQAAVEQGCAEAILVEEGDLVSEGSHTSVFAVRGGKLLTAPNSSHILPGITRGLVLKLAKEANISLEEQAVRKADLFTVDEVFLTGTTTEVMAIVTIDNCKIGAGVPGPITRLLQSTYQNSVRRWLNLEKGR